MESLEKGISPDINSTERGLLKERNLKKGDLVILQKKNIPRSHWSLGRITKIYPGCDSVVCVVKLRTPANEIVPPPNKLYLMEGPNY